MTPTLYLSGSRVEALRLGQMHYFTGKPCKNGHVERRYTRSGACLGCLRVMNSRSTFEFQQHLRAQGFKEYSFFLHHADVADAKMLLDEFNDRRLKILAKEHPARSPLTPGAAKAWDLEEQKRLLKMREQLEAMKDRETDAATRALTGAPPKV